MTTLEKAPPGYALVTQRQLSDLIEKAQAHDDYVAAMRIMAERQRSLYYQEDDFARGYRTCLGNFTDAILAVLRDRGGM